MYNAITDVPGIKVGHYTNPEAATGCTVVLAEAGAVPGVDVRGSGPCTRETDLMRPVNLVTTAHAVVLSGGTVFGLDTAGGVARYLEEHGIGFAYGDARVPIVGAACLFDLWIGSANVRPDAAAGYAACHAASDGPVDEGSVGAGTGGTAGHLLGMEHVTKVGLGTASLRIGGGVIVGALVAVNAWGDIVDPKSGDILAGLRNPHGDGFISTIEAIQGELDDLARSSTPTHSTLGIVATNAVLNKEEVNKVAQMAHDGYAMAIRPVHGWGEGDVIFGLATGTFNKTADVGVVGAVAAQVVAQAVVRAARAATSLAGVPAARDLHPVG